jgi:excisionase family DNA binding protein
MNATARDQSDAGLAERVQRLEDERDLDRATLYVLNARLADLEASNAELRALAGLNPPPPAIGADWRSLKQAAGETGYSETTIRRRIERGKIEARHVGGHVLIRASSLPPRRGETAR